MKSWIGRDSWDPTVFDIDHVNSWLAEIKLDRQEGLGATLAIGRASAAELLLTAGDNPDRINLEAGFAALSGVSPVRASSGTVRRYPLNRDGDRAANSALHITVIGRLRTDPRSLAYVSKRIAEGQSKLEANRCLKRYIAREGYTLIRRRGREIATTRIAT